MGLGAAPPFLVAYLGPALREDLGLTGAQLGLLTGLFYGSTGVVSLLASRPSSRWAPGAASSATRSWSASSW